MKDNKEINVEDYTSFFYHTPSRPIRYVRDKEGFGWLCDKRVDAKGDLRKQGCWRCDEMAFPEGGR